jgi:hypothetical protein
MNSSEAYAVFVAVMGVGFIAWLCSLSLTLRLGTVPLQSDGTESDFEPRSWAGTEIGARTVKGTPAKLSKVLARALTQLSIGGFGSLFEITERTDDRISLRKTGPLMCNQPSGLYFSEADVAFEYLGNNTTRVHYKLGYDRLAQRMRSIALAIILLIGLPVMLTVGSLIWYQVLPSDDRHMRWQVFQSLQIVHAIWPPFLLIGLYSMGRRQSKTYFSNLLSNLELAE